MCVLLVAKNPRPDLKLLVLHNRDEFTHRPFEPARKATVNGKDYIFGVDKVAGGTWLAVNTAGDFSAVLNIRTSPNPGKKPTSRGILPVTSLASIDQIDSYFASLDAGAFNPFNLVLGGPSRPVSVFSSTTGVMKSFSEDRFVISNHSVTENWLKTKRIELLFKERIEGDANQENWVETAFSILEDRERLDASQLPKTGFPPEVELQLSSLFVQIPKMGYQTVLSTVVAVDKNDRVQVFEKNHLNPTGTHKAIF